MNKVTGRNLRIVTDGEVWRVQRRTLWQWHDVTTNIDTREEAEALVKRWSKDANRQFHPCL